MRAVFNTRMNKFKTYEGWTDYEVTKKGKVIKGLEDVMLYTEEEAALNVLKKPLEWRHINPRINWKMMK